MFGKEIISIILAGAIAGNIPFRVQEVDLLSRKEPKVLYFVSKEKIPEYLETLEYQIDKGGLGVYIKDIKFEDYAKTETENGEISNIIIPSLFGTNFIHQGFQNLPQVMHTLYSKLNDLFGKMIKNAFSGLKKKIIKDFHIQGMNESINSLEALFQTKSTLMNIEYIRIKITGYACPMGGSIQKNLELSKQRAEDAARIIRQALHDTIKLYTGADIDDSQIEIETIGGGIIVKSPLVEDVVNELNHLGYNINYGKMKGMNQDELNKFSRAMGDLKNKNWKKWEELKNHMNDLRRVDFSIKVKSKFELPLSIVTIEKIARFSEKAIVGPPPVFLKDEKDKIMRLEKVTKLKNKINQGIVRIKSKNVPRGNVRGGPFFVKFGPA